MRILFLAVGSYGDVLPLAGLAREFVRQGHQVTLFTNPYFEKVIQHSGVEFIPIGSSDEYQIFINNPALWYPYQGAKVIFQYMGPKLIQETYYAILPHIIPGSTILISSFLGWAARLIQETHKVPHVSAYYAPSNFFSGYATPKGPNFQIPSCFPPWLKWKYWRMINRLFLDPLVKSSLNTFRQKLALAPASQFLHEWAASPDLIIGMFPDWFAQPQPDWHQNTVLTGFPLYDDVHDAVLPESIQNFLVVHPQPIVFTPGSINKHGHVFFQQALNVCRKLKRPGIFLTRFPEQLPPSLPPSIKHFSYAQLSALLPKCSALLHHGGIGTCAQAMRAGIPQLIHPLGFDQYDNADRVEQLGIGATVFQKSFNDQSISTKLQDLLDSPRVREQCLWASEHIHAEGGLAHAYKVIASRFI